MEKMEKNLNGRFTKITKRFGQGLQKAGKMLSFSSFVTAAAGVISQILNPLQEINASLDNILAKSGNIKDQAGAMNTSVGLYAALQSAAAAKGIDQAQFNMMGNRVMELIGQAKNGEDNILSKYKDETDMGMALYRVIDALKNMGKTPQRAAMASQIFGSRISGNLAGLLDDGFDEPLKDVLKGVNIAEVESAIESLDNKGSLQSALRANLELRDFVAKDRRITNAIIKSQNQYENYQRGRENRRFENYEDTVLTSLAKEQMLEEIYRLSVPVLQGSIPFMYLVTEALSRGESLLSSLVSGARNTRVGDSNARTLGGGR